jgi:hypothetical protein
MVTRVQGKRAGSDDDEVGVDRGENGLTGPHPRPWPYHVTRLFAVAENRSALYRAVP